MQSRGLHIQDHVTRRQRDVERGPRGAGQVVGQPRRQLLLAERDERRLLRRDIGLRFLPGGAQAERERALREPVGELRRDVRPRDRHRRVELVGIDLRQRFHLVGPQRELVAGKHRDLADFVGDLVRRELRDVDDGRLGADP